MNCQTDDGLSVGHLVMLTYADMVLMEVEPSIMSNYPNYRVYDENSY